MRNHAKTAIDSVLTLPRRVVHAECRRRFRVADSFMGESMFRSLYSFALFVVLLVPEPATFALLVGIAVCLVVSALWNLPSLFTATPIRPAVESTPTASGQ